MALEKVKSLTKKQLEILKKKMEILLISSKAQEIFALQKKRINRTIKPSEFCLFMKKLCEYQKEY